jgi:hypothetical protein
MFKIPPIRDVRRNNMEEFFKHAKGTPEYKLEWVQYQMWLRRKVFMGGIEEAVKIYDDSHKG